MNMYIIEKVKRNKCIENYKLENLLIICAKLCLRFPRINTVPNALNENEFDRKV